MLHFTENGIHQTCPGIDKVWGIPELLERYNPLSGELIAGAECGHTAAME